MEFPELIILDVGHGNCALLRDTEGTVLIDCPPRCRWERLGR